MLVLLMLQISSGYFLKRMHISMASFLVFLKRRVIQCQRVR